MEKLMKFENNNVQITQIRGVWMFELYSVGMALGQVKVAKGIVYPRKDRIMDNVKNADIKPVVHNGQPYITEEQVYDLMLETRTDKCKQFRKWLTNDVLPTLRKTGKYEVEEKPYEYFEKIFNGEPVLTTNDIVYFTGINRGTIDYYLRTNAKRNTDYFYVEGDELKKFKIQNPRINKWSNTLYLITKNGFMNICKAYGVKIDTPKCFENKKVEPKDNDLSYIQRAFRKLKQSCNVELFKLTPEVANMLTKGKIDNQSVVVRSDDKYMIFYDYNAPIHTRRYIISQAIGSIVMGQLDGPRYDKRRGNEDKAFLIYDYSEQVNQFASMMSILSLVND